MNRTLVISTALALLMSTAAIAQTDPAAPAGPPAELQQPTENQAIQIPPPPSAEPNFDDAMASDNAEVMTDEDRGEGRREMRRHGRMAGDSWHRRGPRMGHHGPYPHGWREFHESGKRSPGARFVLNQGDGSPSVVIECAASDSTLECAHAVMPMLDRFLPPRPAGTAAPQ